MAAPAQDKKQQSLSDLVIQGVSRSAPGMAVRGALKGMGMMTGCASPNIAGSSEEEPYAPGSEMCYMHTDGYNYPVRILDNYGNRRQSILIDFQGEETTVPAERLYGMEYCTPSSMRK